MEWLCSDMNVSDLMTPQPVIIFSNASLAKVLQKMRDNCKDETDALVDTHRLPETAMSKNPV
jgi:CBS domain-containing protein